MADPDSLGLSPHRTWLPHVRFTLQSYLLNYHFVFPQLLIHLGSALHSYRHSSSFIHHAPLSPRYVTAEAWSLKDNFSPKSARFRIGLRCMKRFKQENSFRSMASFKSPVEARSCPISNRFYTGRGPPTCAKRKVVPLYVYLNTVTRHT